MSDNAREEILNYFILIFIAIYSVLILIKAETIKYLVVFPGTILILYATQKNIKNNGLSKKNIFFIVWSILTLIFNIISLMFFIC